MPKQFDVTISIPLHLHNPRNLADANNYAREWANVMLEELRGTPVYDESEQPTITIREVRTP